MPKKETPDNVFDVKRDARGVELGNLGHYRMNVDQAINLAAHLLAVLGDKRRELAELTDVVRPAVPVKGQK